MAGEPKRLKLPRSSIITVLLLFCVALEYYFHFVLRIEVVYTHLFYIPIVLAAIWWGLKGGFPVSLFLALLYMSPHLPNPELSELTRGLALIFIGSLLGIVSDGRRRAEAALRQSEQRLSTMLRSISDAVIATDAKGAITFVNPVAKNLTGWDEAEAVGRPLEHVFDIINEQTGEKVENSVARVLREGVVVDLANHTILIAKDGTKRPIANSGASMRDEKGNIIGTVMIFCDATKQKRAKRAMQDALDYAANIVATVREPLLVLDGNLRVISANRSFYQSFHVDPERTEGQLVYELDNRQWDVPKLRELLEDILPKATALTDFELEHDFESLGHRVMSLNARQIFTEKNTVQMILLAIEDITEQKQALRLSEQELAIQNQIADIFLTVSDEEMYSEVLRVVLKALNSKYGVFGYIAENGDLVVPSMTRGVWDQCQVADKRLVFPRETWGDSIWPTAIRQKKTLYSNDPSTRMPEGHIPIHRNITLPIIDQDEVIGLFQIANKETDYDARDIRLLEMIGHRIAPILHARLQRDRLESARGEAELEMQKHRDDLAEMVEIRTHELTEANKELESFNYSVSHDLRAPLRAVSGFAGVLTEEYSGKLDDEGNRLLNIIQENCQTMGRLIDGLLGLSRLGRQQIRFSRIDMEELAREVFEELEPTTSGPKPYLTIKELPPTLGDPAMIRQVFANLLSNAIKFTSSKSNPEIEVSCRKEENAVIYCVKDNGVGFDMEYVDKLFGVFQRLHSSAAFGGSGIGLANVKRIISRHGGEVWAEGKVGEGATFYFTLPKSPANHKTANLDPLVLSVTA